MDIVLIEGMAGAGKSVALGSLEDAGFYCVDNLPHSLLPILVSELAAGGVDKCAFTIDSRSFLAFDSSDETIKRLRARYQLKAIYLTAHTDVIIRRYSETRRKHPLEDAYTTLPEAIAHDRATMEKLSQDAVAVDTSTLKPDELKTIVRDIAQSTGSSAPAIVVTSFGFKNAAPPIADFVFDARCLPNPHWNPELRPLTGLDPQVEEFFQNKPECSAYVEEWGAVLHKWATQFFSQGRLTLSCAVGCTGGKHRSVWVANALAKMLAKDFNVMLRHRDKP